MNSNERILETGQQTSIDMGRFRRLVSYYLECIEKDRSAKVSFFAKQLEQPEWIEVPAGEELSGLSTDELNTRLAGSKALPEFLNAQGTMTRQSYFYGYPIFVNPIYSKKKQTWYSKVEPLFYRKLESQRVGAQISWAFADAPAEINQAVLKAFAPNAEETRDLLSAIGYGGYEAESLSLVELMAKVSSELGNEIWREGNGSGPLYSDGQLAGCFERGLYHRAMVFAMEANSYTQGLEKELKQLSNEAVSIEGTSLANFVGAVGAKLPPDETPLSYAVPLNARQISAVHSALTNPWTVITGPPGTGKSQVVTAIILNAALRKQNVLFASHNHKAVDVVIERANRLVHRPLLLKLGRDSQDKLAEYILNLLAQASDPQTLADRDEAAAEIKRLEQLRKIHIDGIQKLEATLEAVDHSERALEQYRDILGAPVETVLQELGAGIKADLEVVYKRLRLVDALVTVPLGRLVFRLIRGLTQRWVTKPLNGATELLKVLRIPVPEIRNVELEEVREFLNQLSSALPALDAVTVHAECLETLKNQEGLEALQGALIAIDGELAGKGLQFLELWSKCLADGITDPERRSLSQYQAGLHTLADGNRRPSEAYVRLVREMAVAFKDISKFIPGWSVTNLSAKDRVPFIPAMFDLVVIDEASQCDIPSALPLLYRAKRAVIIGDPNQLQHIVQLLRPAEDLKLRARHGLEGLENEPFGYSANSLFNLAQGIVEKDGIVELLEHHRSHQSIVEFSNRHFYQGRLKVVTDYRRLKPDQGFTGLRWIDIKGWATRPAEGGAINEAEAKAVANAVVALVRERGYSGSVGVTTPFRLQANRIRDFINQSLSPAEIESRSLLIDVVHKFQGDERDYMFFSPVVSEGVHDKSLRFLTSTGNLFNVAVTRARSVLTVVGDLERCSTCGVGYLEKFATHAMVTAPNANPATKAFEPEFESPWERVLYDRLRAEGLKPLAQYTDGLYRLDIAILSENLKIDIEVDGERYHKDWRGNLSGRDLVRNMRLEEQGWLVLRFWVYQVRDDLDGCVEKIMTALRET